VSVDLRWLQDHAGKRTTPYPHELAPATPPTCPGCGADLTGRRTAHDTPAVYCDLACARRHESRRQFAAAEAARHERRLNLRHYGDARE
jgi:hypothetical protein